MDGSSNQPSSAMDGSNNNNNNKTNASNNSNTNSNNNKRTNSNINNDKQSSSVTASSSPLASTAIGDSGYCTAGSSTPIATMTTCNGTRSTSSFALPTPIPPSSLSSSSSPGCGCIIMGPPTIESEEITINITPTTGGQFDLTVERNDTIENLKKIISKRLKVAKERICLLHRDSDIENCAKNIRERQDEK
ncbi:hypothetical protein PV326_002478 [Microctonus aethiopoides]|nr:hypothetical protein PV326_002478 [Microctonus aethiopoides]